MARAEFAALLAASLLVFKPVTASEDPSSYPARAVRYVVPYAAGGPTDRVGRLVAAELQKAWGQPVFVDNRPGANAIIGAELVARAPADGYTLLEGTTSTHCANPALYAKLPYDPHELVPVVGLIEGPVYLVVASASRFASVAELVAYARSHPGALRYATSGRGSPQHLAGEMLRTRTAIDVEPVHYSGAAAARLALLRGDVDFYFDSVADAGGTAVRRLGVSSRWRWPLAPGVPTLVEQGVEGFDIRGWFALFVPRGTPASVIERVNATVNAVLLQPALRDQLTALGYRVLGGSSAELAERIEREAADWARLARESGMKAE